MDCRFAQRHLSAYVDGELEPSPMLELEEHLAACGDCSTEHDVLLAMKREIKTRLAPAAAPEHLRARIVSALEDVQPESEEHSTAHGWMTVAAIAAAVMLVLGSVISDRKTTSVGNGVASLPVVDTRPVVATANASAAPSLDFVRDVVSRHKDQLPTEIETQAPERATRWFRDKLNFRVRAVEFAEPSVHLRGARISQVGLEQAAKLYYSVGDSRLTLVVFRAPPNLSNVLGSQSDIERLGAHRAHVGNRDVTYHTLQGYTVPIVQQNDIVYAFAGDLDQGNLLRLVANARIPY